MVKLLKVTAQTPVDQTEYMDRAEYGALLARQLAESAARFARTPVAKSNWVARFWAGLRKYSDAEPRDAHGRWTEGGGLDSVSTAGVSPEGFSIHPYRGTSPTTGYQVAMTGRTEQFPASILDDEPALAAVLRAHREANADLYVAGGNVYIGGWVQGGQLWLEPSERVSSRSEAIAAGRGRDQIAIWDNRRQQEIPTGGSGGLDNG